MKVEASVVEASEVGMEMERQISLGKWVLCYKMVMAVNSKAKTVHVGLLVVRHSMEVVLFWILE